MRFSHLPAARAALLSLACIAACGREDEPAPTHVVVVMPVDPADENDAAIPDASVEDADSGAEQPDGKDAATGLPPVSGCGTVSGKLDLLFVVDNSASMAAEQALLGRELPRMVMALSSGDVDGDGVEDHPKADIQVGVISSDMGLPGPVHPQIRCSVFGDNGLLRSARPCTEDGPTAYLTYAPGETETAPLSCHVLAGTDGCGIEQQLESMLKALTPSTSPVRFALDTLGHGDGPNAGFLRQDSVLAIVHVTDEDDCSLLGSSGLFSVYSDETTYGSIGPNYRCVAFPELLHPTSRYVDTLKALRPGVEGSIFFAAIAGVPSDLAQGEHSVREMLDDPRMENVPSGELKLASTAPVPACTATRVTEGVTEQVAAAPARRLLEVAEAFGEHAIVASICEETFQLPIEAIAKRIGGVLACPDDPIIF